jgi:hypothetical protein
VSEFRRSQNKEKLLEPGYWGGLDIFSDELGADPGPYIYHLGRRDYKKRAENIFETLKDIKAGNYTEVKYSAGSEFNPDPDYLPDGTVVVLDTEQLIKTAGIFHERAQTLEDELDPIFNPYAEYWKVHAGSLLSGRQYFDFEEHSAFYGRALMWGVLNTDKKHGRAMQLFQFHILPTYSFRAFLDMNRFYGVAGAVKLPLVLGQVSSRSTQETKAFSKFRQIDIVYPAQANRERYTKFLPKFLGRAATSSSF